MRAAELERSWLHVTTTPRARAQRKRFVQEAHQSQLGDVAIRTAQGDGLGQQRDGTVEIDALWTSAVT